jgi:hypothetical protein
MIRGTTPTHTFAIPFDVSNIECLQIIYAQNGEAIVIKEKDDCTLSGQTISVKLKQEDTLSFMCQKKHVQIQIRIKTHGGEVLASPIESVDVDKCLYDEVL